jgi:hypothetical protein
MLELTQKPDFARTVARFEAWWDCEIVDRPPVTLTVRSGEPDGVAATGAVSPQAAWMDPEESVERAAAALARCVYPGDSFPRYVPDLGPDLTSTLFGCELRFSNTTSWVHPVVHDASAWPAVLDRPPDFANRYWKAIEQMTTYALAACGGRFLVGIADLHGNYDILSALRGPEALCVDLLECPDLIRRAGERAAVTFVEAFERLRAQVASAGHSFTTWCPYHSIQPAYLPSCDFWCMLSTRMAQEYVVSSIQREMKPLQRSLFHLDGPQALRHLDLVLDLPSLNGVQWVYGAGNGPAARWADVYRRIQAAGKCLQVTAEDGADALAAVSGLRPEGVWMVIRSPFDSMGSAEAFLRDVERWTCA